MASKGMYAAREVMAQFPNEDIVFSLEKEFRQRAREYAFIAEEVEKQRRILESRFVQEDLRLASVPNRAFAVLKETEEKLERVYSIMQMKSTKKPETQMLTEERKLKEESELDKAYVHVLEEQERARRIAEDSYKDEIEEEQRKDNQAYATVAEEQEKERRISEEQYQEQLESEHRADDRAYAIIQEEKERERRISMESYVEQQEKSKSEENRAFTVISEEQERQRRIAEDSYLVEQDEKRRNFNRKNVQKLEEQERKRRMQEKPPKSMLVNLRNTSEIIADAAKRKSEGSPLRVVKFKKPRRGVFEETRNLEEMEKSRRIREKPNSDQLSILRNLSNEAATAASQKWKGEQIVSYKFKQPWVSKDAKIRRKFIAQLEEEEKNRRLTFKPLNEQLNLLKKLAHGASQKVPKQKPILSRKFRIPAISQMEEQERERRVREKPNLSNLSMIRNIAVIAADAANKKVLGEKIVPAKYKIQKQAKKTEKEVTDVGILEEKERARRMAEPLPSKKALQLKVISREAATAASLPKQVRKTFKKPQRVRKYFTKNLEESERARRLKEKPSGTQLGQLRMVSRAAAEQAIKKSKGQSLQKQKFKVTPAFQREQRRVSKETAKPDLLQRLKGVAKNVAESVQKRLTTKEAPRKFKRRTVMRKNETRALEEEERERRMSEKPSPEQLRHLKNLSHSMINELKSHDRHKVMFKKPSVSKREWARKQEEQERQRRISEKPTSDQLTLLRNMANAAVERKVNIPIKMKKETGREVIPKLSDLSSQKLMDERNQLVTRVFTELHSKIDNRR